jgi:hypothetical protein
MTDPTPTLTLTHWAAKEQCLAVFKPVLAFLGPFIESSLYHATQLGKSKDRRPCPARVLK